jgi:hypothetical protein
MPEQKPQEVATVEPAVVPSTLLSAIVALAKDPQVDVHKLDALLAMQSKMESRQAEREFIAAFSRLSGDLPRVKKNGTIDLGKGKAIPFARWEDMDAIIRPAMTREGFTLSFDSSMREGGGVIVTGTLMHRDGHTRTASIPLPPDAGPGRNALQSIGSSLSYGRRYCAEMLLNIIREGEDDNGRLGGMRFITAEQVAELESLLKETGSDEARYLQILGVAHLSNIEVGAWAAARNLLLGKLKRTQS